MASGRVRNDRGLYSAPDSVKGEWLHHCGAKGSGHWDFVTDRREDRVEILGSHGKITFAVLDEAPLILERGKLREKIEIPHPTHVQAYHVLNMGSHLLGESQHPSTGLNALGTQQLMDQILDRKSTRLNSSHVK